MKRFWAMLLACTLGLGCACAQDLDGALSAYLDTDSDVHYAMTAEFASLLPYGEGTVEMINGALKNLRVEAFISGDETQMQLCVAGDPLMQLSERAVAGGTQLKTNLLPNRTLESSGSALDALLGMPEAENSFDLFAAIEEAEGCYQELTDAIKPYAEEKKANYKIKGVATSKWSRIARLTVEQGEEIAPLIAQLLSCGMDEAYRQQLSSLACGKGFIVGLYQLSEGGDDLAVYMKGDVTLSDGKPRSLSYQWAFHTGSDGVRVDSFKLELSKSRASADTRVISGAVKRQTSENKLLLKGETSARIKDAQSKTVTTEWEYDLSGKASDGVRTITGDALQTVRTTVDDVTVAESTAFEPSLKLTSAQGSGVLSGKVHIESKTGKNTHTECTLIFDEETAETFADAAESGALFAVTIVPPEMPQSSLTQNMAPAPEVGKDSYLVGQPPIGYTAHKAPDKPVRVDADALSESARAALVDEMVQNLAGQMLITYAKLGAEDSALIRDNLSEEDYNAFLSLVEGL